MQKYYVYQHIREDKNEVFYIGIGTKFRNKYYTRAFCKTGRNNIWERIFSKTNFKVEILFESNDYEEVKRKEIKLIAFYGRKDLGTGILANMTDGGDGTTNKSQEVKDKISKSNKGKKLSEEAKQRISYLNSGERSARYGKKNTDKQKEAVSKRFKGVPKTYKIEHSEESKKKMSESKSGEKHVKSKKVINIMTKEIFNTVTSAAKSIDINRGNLSKMLLSKSKNKTNFMFLDIFNLIYDSKKE